MKNVTLKLGIIALKPVVVINPYWFTTDGSIHLNDKSEGKEVDLDSLSSKNLSQIRSAVSQNLLQIKEMTLIQLDEYIKSLTTPEVVEVEKPVVVPEVTVKSIQNKRNDILTTEAEEILLKSAVEIKKIVGDANIIEDDIVAPGIENIKLLERLIECETNGRKRKNVLTILNYRINAIKDNGIVISPDVLETVEEIEDRKIVFDSENQQLKEIVK